MSRPSEACRASALHCLEIADKAASADDQCAFLSLASSWQKLANEIECAERLITFIDQLATSDPAQRHERKQIGLPDCHQSSRESLQRLTTAIVSTIAEHLATRRPAEDSGRA